MSDTARGGAVWLPLFTSLPNLIARVPPNKHTAGMAFTQRLDKP